MLRRNAIAAQACLYLAGLSLLLQFSTPPLTDRIERIRAFTRDEEFDYVSWIAEAAWKKVEAASVGLPDTMRAERQAAALADYLSTTQRRMELELSLEGILALPPTAADEAAASRVRGELARVESRQKVLTPIAESVLQQQLTDVLADFDLTLFGQPLPAVLYQTTRAPLALIVSPRHRIEQAANISLQADLTLDATARLERQVDQNLDVSSLVVPVGGVGVYPTMVIQSTDVRWLAETVAHEWTHNYLTLRPLGALYDASSELRTMNETTAAIVGTEVAGLYMDRFHHEPAGAAERAEATIQPARNPRRQVRLAPPSFDFRAEMHETRIHTDRLLAEGRIEVAEAYMEARRLFFVENGFPLRKLNQAYFAFYGAYGDIPGGAAGEDPVGAAVRELRAMSDSLASFLNRMSWLTSFQQLEAAIIDARVETGVQ